MNFQNVISTRFCMGLHVLNILHVLLLPIMVIYVKYEQIGPGNLPRVVCRSRVYPDQVKSLLLQPTT